MQGGFLSAGFTPDDHAQIVASGILIRVQETKDQGVAVTMSRRKTRRVTDTYRTTPAPFLYTVVS